MSDEGSSYSRIRDRLEEIVTQIRSKDVPLEKSLDLYEEALRLGGMAAEAIDNTDFTEAEIAAVEALFESSLADGDADSDGGEGTDGAAGGGGDDVDGGDVDDSGLEPDGTEPNDTGSEPDGTGSDDSNDSSGLDPDGLDSSPTPDPNAPSPDDPAALDSGEAEL